MFILRSLIIKQNRPFKAAKMIFQVPAVAVLKKEKISTWLLHILGLKKYFQKNVQS